MSNSAQSSCCVQSSTFSTSLGILLVRLALGAVFIYYGGQHLFGLFGGHGLHQFSTQIKTDGFPILPPTLWAVISGGSEFFGGILLLVGLISRPVALIIIIDQICALWVMRRMGFGGVDFNITLIAMLALVLLAGAGSLSVDSCMFRAGADGAQPLTAAKPAS